LSVMESKPPLVLLVGDVMKDVIVLPEGEMRRGSDQAAEIEVRPGGSAANQAVWLAFSGVPAILLARVGASEQKQLWARFKRLGVEAHLIPDPDRDTGILVSLIHSDGERSFFTDRGANEALCQADLPHKVLDGVGLLLLSGYSFFAPAPRRVVRFLMARAKARNIPVAIDPSSTGFLSDVGVENFLAWTRGAAMIFPNEDEAELLSGAAEAKAQLARLGEFYSLVVIKQGANGASAMDESGEIISVPSPKVEIVDTTGAGDAFAAGFLRSFLAEKELKASLLSGVEAGANAVGQVGAQPDINNEF